MIKERRRYHPGTYIKDSIEALEMSNKEFSFRTGISERTLSDIISEKGSVTFAVAEKLARFFNNSINLWLNLQSAYDEYVSEKQKESEIELDYSLVKQYKDYLIENNFITKDLTKKDIVERARQLVSINRLSYLRDNEFVVSYKEQKNDGDPFAKNFWVAYALTEARKIETKPFNKNKLLLSINKIRDLSVTEPTYFMPKLKEIFSECGVSFVYIPYLKKSNIYGVTKWMSSEHVMIAISNRSERADMFWFTLFHEMSHVIYEHKRYYCIQSKNTVDDIADSFAKDFLIRPLDWEEFISKGDFSANSVRKFADTSSVLPMIVVGRLQKENKVGYDSLYKTFYKAYDEKELIRK